MLGQIPKCGTGDSEIILDEEKLNYLMDVSQDEPEAQEENINEIFNQDTEIIDDMFNR